MNVFKSTKLISFIIQKSIISLRHQHTVRLSPSSSSLYLHHPPTQPHFALFQQCFRFRSWPVHNSPHFPAVIPLISSLISMEISSFSPSSSLILPSHCHLPVCRGPSQVARALTPRRPNPPPVSCLPIPCVSSPNLVSLFFFSSVAFNSSRPLCCWMANGAPLSGSGSWRRKENET